MVVEKLLGTFLKIKIKCEDQRIRHNQGFKLMNFEYCENKSVLCNHEELEHRRDSKFSICGISISSEHVSSIVLHATKYMKLEKWL